MSRQRIPNADHSQVSYTRTALGLPCHADVASRCVQVIPASIRPKPEQLMGLAAWGPIGVGGLFFLIGDPGIRFIQESVGLRAPESDKKDEPQAPIPQVEN